MKQRLAIFSIVLFSMVSGVISCVHKPQIAPAGTDGNYPPDVARIIINKCAVSGCHNAASYGLSDSLLMDTWDHLFNGGSNGAVVVAYSPQFSSLLYFVNTDSSLGPIAKPTMPDSTATNPRASLSRDEYMVLYNWIANGAPDKNGNIPFASNPDTRQKIYMTQQGCDLLAVVDADRKVVMRYIPIGMDDATIESPHCVRMADDGMHAYVSFINGNYVQKIDTRTDKVVGSANVGSAIAGGTGGSWNILHVSHGQDTALMVSDWQGDGMVLNVQTAAMTLGQQYGSGGGTFVYPHGIASNPTFDTFFITAQYGNLIYKMSADGNYFKKLSLNGAPAVAAASDSANITSPNPHEILMVPDFSKYFVTCQTTNEVRVLDAHTNRVLDSIPVGTFPQELAVSTKYPYMFVTCMEDGANPNPGNRGSVYVINYNTYEIVKVIYGDFYQPHGITIDERNDRVYVVSTNANPNGPAPHHATACTGRDGWYSVYDLNTLQPVSKTRYEVTVMPYSAATRFSR